MKCVILFSCFIFLIECINASLIPRIFGGENASVKDFPYQASLRRRGHIFCGATIISKNHVLTAAHCITNHRDLFIPPYSEVIVSTGTSSSRAFGHLHRIAKIAIHPGFTGTAESSLENDIAVVTLDSDIQFNEKEQKALQPKYEIPSGTKADLTGWGYTSGDSRNIAAELQKLRMTVLSSEDCQKEHSLKIYKNQLCAYHSKGHGGCSGDSGGPLVVNKKIVGILSWIIDGDCATGLSEVYTNVYAHKDFILSVMND